MKKLLSVSCALIIGILACVASQSESNTPSSTTIEIASSSISVPTGAFFNGNDFIYVQQGWLRICINQKPREYNYQAQMDPYGNYVLTFGNECVTIHPNGRSLYYNGTTYSKRNLP